MIATDVVPIHLSYPEETELRLHVALGACRLKITPGTGEEWVSGTYEDRTGTMPCDVTRDGGTVRLTAGQGPEVLLGMLSGGPIVDLSLGTTRPFALTLELAGGDFSFDLGGLPITRFVFKLGAGRAIIDFSSPNPEAMTFLQYSTGAGQAEFSKLANANCGEMVFEGGAVSLRCDFGGELQRDAHARVATGASLVELVIPPTTSAAVTAQTLVGGVEASGGWASSNGIFVNAAGGRGQSPTLRISATSAIGPVRLFSS